MKNQYFGDGRDALKYDCWLTLAERIPGIKQVTFVPMLTPNDDSREGNRFFSRATGRSAMFEFLSLCAQSEGRRLTRLREFMATLPLPYRAYKDDEHFTHDQRTMYFSQLPTEWLSDAAVLVDPDIGLETGSLSYMRRSGLDKYLFYTDVELLLRTIANRTVLLIYQHLQRDARRVDADLHRRLQHLRTLPGCSAVACVRAHDVAFIALARHATLAQSLPHVLEEYARARCLQYLPCHGALPSGGGDLIGSLHTTSDGSFT